MSTRRHHLFIQRLSTLLDIGLDLDQNRLSVQLGRHSLDDFLDTGDLGVDLSIEEKRDLFEGQVSSLDPVFGLCSSLSSTPSDVVQDTYHNNQLK